MLKKLSAEITTAIKERSTVLGAELGLNPEAVEQRVTEIVRGRKVATMSTIDDAEARFRREQTGGKPEKESRYFRPDEDPADVVEANFAEREPTRGGTFIREDSGQDDED